MDPFAQTFDQTTATAQSLAKFMNRVALQAELDEACQLHDAARVRLALKNGAEFGQRNWRQCVRVVPRSAEELKESLTRQNEPDYLIWRADGPTPFESFVYSLPHPPTLLAENGAPFDPPPVAQAFLDFGWNFTDRGETRATPFAHALTMRHEALAMWILDIVGQAPDEAAGGSAISCGLFASKQALKTLVARGASFCAELPSGFFGGERGEPFVGLTPLVLLRLLGHWRRAEDLLALGAPAQSMEWPKGLDEALFSRVSEAMAQSAEELHVFWEPFADAQFQGYLTATLERSALAAETSAGISAEQATTPFLGHKPSRI